MKSYPSFTAFNASFFSLVVLTLLFAPFGGARSAAGQSLDSLRLSQPDSISTSAQQYKNSWVSRPPTGKSEKLQGSLLMLAGGVIGTAGILNLNAEDPCENFSSRNATCLSNVEEVRTVGAVQAGLGALSFLLGVIRHGTGQKKARKYAEWQRNNLTVAPVLKQRGDQTLFGIEVSF